MPAVVAVLCKVLRAIKIKEPFLEPQGRDSNMKYKHETGMDRTNAEFQQRNEDLWLS